MEQEEDKKTQEINKEQLGRNKDRPETRLTEEWNKEMKDGDEKDEDDGWQDDMCHLERRTSLI